MVNWCPGLGTVLANDEVKDGFPNAAVFRQSGKNMPSEYAHHGPGAQRLLDGLETIDRSESIKGIPALLDRSFGRAAIWF